MPDFPNVPNVPGVPLLPRAPGALGAGITLLIADAIAGILGLFGPPQWGIYLFGFPVVVADNVVTFDFKRDWNIADYPIEDGGFESYDKVAVPFDVRLRYSTGGSDSDRQAFLASVAAIAGTLDLFDVVTPEVTYLNMNVEHYDYRRSARNGVGLLVIDVWLKEVRVEATAAFSNTNQPNVAGPQNTGTVQPTTPPAEVRERFSQFQ